VSAVETPPPPESPEEHVRRCPRCGAQLTPQQDWCLACGADVGTRIAGTPGWRGPVALVAGLLAIAIIALVLALVQFAGDAETVTSQPGTTPTPTPAAAQPTATPTPESTTIPPATSEGGPGTTPEIADWPDGKDAWTVVLEASATKAAAQARASELAAQGVPVGMLNSDLYGSLEPHKWVVFSGQYDSQRAANQGLSDLSGQITGGYVRHVVPGTTGGASPTPSASATPSP
jgi:sporulation related protein